MDNSKNFRHRKGPVFLQSPLISSGDPFGTVPALRPFTTYSHSIVAGGFPETSYTTRLMPLISLIIRLETVPSSS